MVRELMIDLDAVLGLLTIVAVLIGVLIYQNARSNRWLKSVDRSLKMLPGVNRELKRVA